MRKQAAVPALAVLAVLTVGVTTGYAQRIFAGFYGNTPPRFPTSNSFQGSFTFCRAMFSSDRREIRIESKKKELNKYEQKN